MSLVAAFAREDTLGQSNFLPPQRDSYNKLLVAPGAPSDNSNPVKLHSAHHRRTTGRAGTNQKD